MLSRPQFKVKRDELLKVHPDWNKVGVEQVWKFAHIKEGDRIVANKGLLRCSELALSLARTILLKAFGMDIEFPLNGRTLHQRE